MTSNVSTYTLLLTILTSIFGIVFYCRGFLLTRYTLTNRSACDDVLLYSRPHNVCWTEARYKRAVIVIIDALRYDFIEWQQNMTADQVMPYHNRLEHVEYLLNTYPQHTLLVPFIADPPTTTMQRLKGLTTGSLPTFIDAGSNFAATAIGEDNWVDQLRQMGKNITLLGDDTWVACYPKQFTRSFAMPSFDVKDLHTVDNAVLKHIYEELNRTDWQVLIAHLLGVDHAGHRYGPVHEQMSMKLLQMNEMIKNVTSQLQPDTILFLIGDHGMTDTGDHGGDSFYETRSALFAFVAPNKAANMHNENANRLQPISQIDLVPTLSLLLDLPVPYASLGAPITALFPDSVTQVNVVRATTWQHDEEDTSMGTLFCSTTFQAIFRSSWATFHIGWMLVGVCTIVEAAMYLLRLLTSHQISWSRNAMKLLLIVVQMVALVHNNESVPQIVIALILLSILCDAHTILFNAFMYILSDISISMCSNIVVTIIYTLSFFSNSYVVYEYSVVRFLLILSILGVTLPTMDFSLANKDKEKGSTKFTNRRSQSVQFALPKKLIVVVLILFLLFRLSSLFLRCRDEMQQHCTPQWLTVPLVSFSNDDLSKLLRLVIACVCMITVTFFTRTMLQRNGNLNDNSLQSLFVTFSFILFTLCVCAQFVFSILPDVLVEKYSFALRYMPPLMIYLIALLLIITTFYQPSFVHVVDDNTKRVDVKHLYGAMTCLSSPCLVYVYAVVTLLITLSGDTSTLPFLITLLIIFTLLQLSCFIDHNQQVHNTSFVFIWSLLASHTFYTLHHQPIFAAIPWHSAFVGIPGNFQYRSVPAAFVISNLFSGHIICAITLPLLIIWRWSEYKLPTLFSLTKKQEKINEYTLFKSQQLFASVVCVANQYLLLAVIKLCGTMVATFIHRRHLMVWAIFAPRLIFETIAYLVTCIALCVTLLFINRLHNLAIPKDLVVETES